MHTERVYDVGTDEKKSLKELLEDDLKRLDFGEMTGTAIVRDVDQSAVDKAINKFTTGSPTGVRPPNRKQKRKMEKDARRAKSKVDA